MNLLKLTSLFLVMTFYLHATAADIPPRPNPPRLVNDLAGLLTNQQQEALEYKLRYFNDTTSNQIVVVIVKSLEGNAPYDFAYRIGKNWGVGQKDFNNGIVVLVKPKYGASDQGHAFIATGYGLEGIIPDATAGEIVDNEMIPNFKQAKYYEGIDQATNVLMKLASGEISAKGYNKTHQAPWFLALLPFLIIVFIIMLIGRSQRNTHGIASRGSNGLWTALLLGSMLGNRSHGGSWSNFSGGSSGFGGGGSGFGGGFGGFGGGSFGGGGAGGSW